MCDLQLMYRECGAETRDDYLRDLANENGLPLACVRRIVEKPMRCLTATCSIRLREPSLGSWPFR